MKRHIAISLVMILGCSLCVNGQPDFTRAITANGMRFYGDARQPTVYYYPPGELVIGTFSDGRPDFSLLLMRFSSSTLYGDDNQTIRHKNMLTMRIEMKQIKADSLSTAHKELKRIVPHATIKPLPVNHIDAMIVFTPVGESDSTAIVKQGEVATDTPSGYSSLGSFWRERYFTIFLDNYSAMLLTHALEHDMRALSFMYAFYANGLTDKKVLDIGGHGKLIPLLQRQFKQDSIAQSADPVSCIVKSDAFGIQIDTAKYDLIHRYDVGETMPPGYALLNVRNYDFANDLREDLYEKIVDLEATSVAGAKVKQMVRFTSKHPDVTSTNFRFKFAVRLDQPYRYRVRELLNDGKEVTSEWKEIDIWSAMLDVTTRNQ